MLENRPINKMDITKTSFIKRLQDTSEQVQHRKSHKE